METGEHRKFQFELSAGKENSLIDAQFHSKINQFLKLKKAKYIRLAS